MAVGRRHDNPGMSKESEPVPDIAVYGTGALQSRGFTLEGEMHGAWEFFRKDGSVMRTGEFDRGRQVGIWRTLDRAGRLVKETNFSKGR
jgi:antitoxin component YwqK of YwqJK toxin-antitoxin module